MKTTCRLSLALLLVAIVSSTALKAQDNTLEKKNLAYLELGGMADFYSLNYERILGSKDSKGKTTGSSVRLGVAPKPGETWAFGTFNLLSSTKPVMNFENIFFEAGAGPIYRYDFGVNKSQLYAGLMGGMRSQPSASNPWLVKADVYFLLLRTPGKTSGFLGYVFPWIGVSLGRAL